MINFNKPYLTGNEQEYILDAVNSGKISGNGKYTKLCHEYFERNFQIKKTLMTTSCTDALEMSALLANLNPEDEIIIPAYTFVSSALAFVREKAKIKFIDSRDDHPGMDEDKIEEAITSKTKVIVPVHYAGVACEMDKIINIAKKNNILVVEDAAQGISSKYKTRYLGTIGDLGAFSFHETKNIQCGEGGLLAINNPALIKRAEILWEKGTNRSDFFRGEINKYDWIDIGSSFLPSEINSAFLYAQLEKLNSIQDKRLELWNRYYENLKLLGEEGIIQLPIIPDYATNNAHMFYIITENIDVRQNLISYLNKNGIHSVFHYLCLHKSPYYKDKYRGKQLKNSEKYENQLLRLPLYIDLQIDEVDFISSKIIQFFKNG